MILPALKEAILMTARGIDPAIIDLTWDQKWHHLRVHSVDLERYSRQTGGIELLPEEIEAGSSNIRLAWTSRWLHSPAAMENIVTDPKRRTVSLKITVTSVDDRDTIKKNGI